MKTERDERWVRETSLYLALGLALELALQPVAAVLGVSQGLRNGPQLSCNGSFLLHNLLQLCVRGRGGHVITVSIMAAFGV